MNAHAYSPSTSWIGKVLFLAAAYYVAARLALLLVIPPGYATAIWPAAGVALGGLLLLGRRVWPGVWLGSFLVNLGTTFDAGSPRAAFVSVALPLGISLGATLQAFVGAALVRRYVGIPNPLDRERPVATLLLLGGPVSCLIDATAAVFLLGWTDRLTASESAFTWWTWWVSDTIGVFLATPLLLLWGDRSRPDWPRRPVTVTLPLAAMAALFVALFVYVSGRDQGRIGLASGFPSDAMTPGYLPVPRSMHAWSVLAGGMLYTSVIGAVLLVITGRTVLIEDRVEERTAELARANAELVKEIAERHRAEEERDRFFLLSIDLFCVAGFDGYFKRVNESFARVLGYTTAELLGAPFLDFVHPDDLRSTGAEVERLAGGAVTIDFENRYRGKDGTYRWIQWNATAFADRGVIYAVGRDITDRKRVERQMQEFNDTLERRVSERTAALEQQSQELHTLIDALSRSNQELDDFAYIASHDLKEPMRGIANYAAFLVEDYAEKLDDAGRTKLGTLQRLCGRMTDLLDALLHYSRLGRTDLAVGQVDLNEIVGQVLDSVQFLIEERGVTIDVPIPLPVVRCDRARVGEVFRNLITNAIKYNDKNEKRVEIGARFPEQPGSPIVFHVRDNGIGIREKHLESVFRIFKRLHGRDLFGGGTGAGLTIAKKIVARHGGRIWIESAFGEGTTVLFTLQGDFAT